MTTPIVDFVKKYAATDTVRFHMPGHKGNGPLGCEKYDITEIYGADVLYSADGIIAESEDNLTSLYGTAHSFYSTEGSTLAIKAMLALVAERHTPGERVCILAARNIHTAFIKAAALLDLDIEFIYPSEEAHLCSCPVSAEAVRAALSAMSALPRAVYLTSPDYLGGVQDIAGISAVCREYGIPLLVDNAHGAYLNFLEENTHPIAEGAAMCADSAHKTLPVLTGGAYLHISKDYAHFAERARGAMSLFASTSPSYLMLASLDSCNARLASDYPEKIRRATQMCDILRMKIAALGYTLAYGEPLKIVIRCGTHLSEHLRARGIEPEFSDVDHTVLMITPENSEADFDRLVSALASFSPPVSDTVQLTAHRHRRVLSVREAMLAASEIISVPKSVGRICASPCVSCPPAVPIVVSGEIIDERDVALFSRYGIDEISVVK